MCISLSLDFFIFLLNIFYYFFFPCTTCIFFTPLQFFLYLCLSCRVFLQPFNLLRVPITNMVFLYIFFWWVAHVPPEIGSFLSLFLILFHQISWVVVALIYILFTGCTFCLLHLRRKQKSQVVGTTLVQVKVVLWSSRFCLLFSDPTNKTDTEGRGQQHSLHKPLRT